MRQALPAFLVFLWSVLAAAFVAPWPIMLIVLILDMLGGTEPIREGLFHLLFYLAHIFPPLRGGSEGTAIIVVTWIAVAIGFSVAARRLPVGRAVLLGLACIAGTTLLIVHAILPMAGIHVRYPTPSG